MRAVLSLGSNLGNSAEILSSASEALNEVSEVIALSSFIKQDQLVVPHNQIF